LKQVEWNVLILIAGGISLGAGFQMTGLDHAMLEALPSGEATRDALLPSSTCAGSAGCSGCW
jgi:di/tricarboxylate transporter